MRRWTMFLILALAATAWADEPSWIGRQVMLRESGCELEIVIGGRRIGEGQLNSWEVFTVHRDANGRIWIRNREVEGWLDKKNAVLIEEAVDWFNSRIGRNPQDESALAHRARAHHFLGEYEKAVSDFSEAIKLSPHAAWIWNNRAIVWADMKEYDKSIEDYTKAVTINPTYYLPYSNRGLIWLKKREFTKALEDFNQSLRHNSRYSYAYSNRALLQIEKHELLEAQQDSEHALQLNPGATTVRVVRGQVLFALHRYDEALREFHAAIQLEPRNAGALVHRGRTNAKLGYFEQARRDFEEAIRLRSFIDWYHRDYAYFLATCADDRFRDGGKAEQHLQKARTLKIDLDLRFRETEAATAAERGRFEEAVQHVQTALRDASVHSKDAEMLRERLRRYEMKQPWRE